MEIIEASSLPRIFITKKVRKYSLGQYIRKEELSDEKYEFFDGRMEKMPPTNGSHNILAVNIAFEIRQGVEKTNQKSRVLISRQKVFIPYINAVIFPDVLVIDAKPLFWDDCETLLINPVLVVEILSKNKKVYNRTNKYDKYKTLESFREYVLIHQDECYAEVRYQFKTGFWQETIVKEIGGVLPLQSLGIEILLKRIYKNIELAEKSK